MSNDTTPEPRPTHGSEKAMQPATTRAGTEPSAPLGKDTVGTDGVRDTPQTRQKKKAKSVITTFEELVSFVYESNSRLLDLSKDAFTKLPISDEHTESQRSLVVSLASSDPTMSAPFKLLQYAARQGVHFNRAEDGDLGRSVNRLVDLALVALSQHPVFRVWMHQLLDPRRNPQLTTEYLRDAARKISAEQLGVSAETFKPTDSERLAKNAVACFGLLRALQREWTLDEFIDATYRTIWKFEAPATVGLQRGAGELAASRDHAVLGIVGTNYVARLERLDRHISQLERDAEVASNREMRLRQKLASAEEREKEALARAEAFSADVVRLQKELLSERDNRVVDKSHMADDYETLRTRIIRRLGGEIDLLTDGLHALRNGAPNVAEEFLDRSLLALTREVEQLKDASGGLA